MHVALKLKNEDVIAKLKGKVDKTIKNSNGKTIVEIAQENNIKL